MPLTNYKYRVARILVLVLLSWLHVGNAQTLTLQPDLLRADKEPAQRRQRYSLEGLVGVAVASYPGVAARRAELAAAESEIDSARWQFFPTPSLQLQRDSHKGEPATVLSVKQPLWHGGALTAGLDAAGARANSAAASVSEAQYTLAIRLANAYYAWLQARGRIDSLVKSINLHEDYAERIRRRLIGGVSAESDLELLQSRLAQTRGDLKQARAAERSALAQMVQMTGLPLVTSDIALARDLSEDRLPAIEEILSLATANHPTLRRLEFAAEAAGHEVEQKRAVLQPQLSLRADRYWRNSTNVTTTLPRNESTLNLVVDYTPGAGLSAGSNIAAARARAGGLRDGRDAARSELIERIAADYEECAAGRSRKQDLLRTRESSMAVLASYDRLFIAGKRGWLDVLNAARELIQVELALADVEAQIVAARYRLRLHAGEPAWLQQEAMR